MALDTRQASVTVGALGKRQNHLSIDTDRSSEANQRSSVISHQFCARYINRHNLQTYSFGIWDRISGPSFGN